jgi:hypothetical protein
MAKISCCDCDGTGEIVASWYGATRDEPRCPRQVYECVRCDGHGWTEEDDRADDDGPEPVAPDGVPLSSFASWALLTVALGGDDAAAISASRVLRSDAA